MNLQEKEVGLIHRALDQELEADEEQEFETLLAQKSDAQSLYQGLSQVIGQVNRLPEEDAPYDIAARVTQALADKSPPVAHLQPSSSSSHRSMWAIAASLVIAIGILSLNVKTTSETELVGTLVSPGVTLDELVYLAEDSGWVLGINIVQDSDFRLLLKDVPADWDIESRSLSEVTLVRHDEQIEIIGHGPIELNFPLVDNRSEGNGVPPGFQVELVLDDRVYSGELTLKIK